MNKTTRNLLIAAAAYVVWRKMQTREGQERGVDPTDCRPEV